MAIENKAVVYIGGRNYTHYTVMPLKWGNLLDERLDEMYLSLRRCPVEVFKPLTPVEIHFTNRFYYGSKTIDTQTQVKRYIVANDPQAVESPVGSGRWNHDLYIIELTKYLECIVVDTNTITNDLGRTYVKNSEVVVPDTVIDAPIGNATIYFQDAFFQPVSVPTYVTPILSGTQFTFLSPTKVFQSFWNQWKDYSYTTGISPAYSPYLRITVRYNGDVVYEQYWSYTPQTKESYGRDKIEKDYVASIQTGTYTLEYRCELISYQVSTSTGGPTFTANGHKYSLTDYTFTAAYNYYPLKKWTMADVINRLFDIAEPLRMGEKARFSLDPQQEAKFDTILAPQMSFTKNTLRECLKECGKVLHGEPRLDVEQAEEGSFSFVVRYDMFGQTERSGISHKAYITKTVSQAIDSYASHLDSNVDNLVNQLSGYEAKITEPYAGGYKTVRTETMYARITDANMLIQTQFPIYSVKTLRCGFFTYKKGTIAKGIDLTKYVFESSIYNTQLSSYSDEYPNSKAYGLMYTQGQRNITALNFKQEDPISPIFKSYAIINMLMAETGRSDLIDEDGNADGLDYPLLAFQIEYIPIYNSRVSQTKVNYQDYPYGAGLIYNQQANIVEARYYGENLKGAIARIGNVEKSITYRLARLSEIPEAGQLYDEDYYISAVSVEFLPTVIKCSIGLSKDFNRLSAYIGVSSVKRFFEVSEKQAAERNTLWREYVVIGDEIAQDTDSLIGDGMMLMLADTFTQAGGYEPLTNVVAWGATYKQENLNEVDLPLISSAFGNSIAFSWEYEDNYSAGAISQYAEGGVGDTEVKGYFQNNYQYADYYGKIYYYNFDLQVHGEIPLNQGQQTQIGTALPEGEEPTASSGYISTVGQSPYILRKDNREKLQCNFQIDLVSNRKGMIIGSALASYCPAVRGSDRTLEPQLYVFDEPLNKFIDHVGGEGIDLSGVPHQPVSVSTVASGRFSVTSSAFAASGKAWAIVTAQTEESQTVEDEKGEVMQQVTQKGGDVLLAMNMDISAGQAFTPIYFTRKRKIFKEEAWIATK